LYTDLNIGATPYQECKELEVTDLMSQIKTGYRLPKPEVTPDERFVLIISAFKLKAGSDVNKSSREAKVGPTVLLTDEDIKKRFANVLATAIVCFFRYELMLQCWDRNPDKRPTFHDIVETTQMHIASNTVS
jgi:hypothetical protein